MTPTAKKIHRFLIAEIPSTDAFTVSDPHIVRQVSRILALRPGEEIILFSDGSDDVVARIEQITDAELQLQTVRRIPALPASRVSLIAAVSIPKSDTFETIVQKLTELGVTEIIPIRSARTVKQSVRIDRLQSISDEALEQCGGNRKVIIREPIDLAECLAHQTTAAFVYDASGEPLPTTIPPSCIMYIGPEGGWSDQDKEQFAAAGTTFITLGHRILRTDTAAIVGAFQLLS